MQIALSDRRTVALVPRNPLTRTRARPLGLWFGSEKLPPDSMKHHHLTPQGESLKPERLKWPGQTVAKPNLGSRNSLWSSSGLAGQGTLDCL